MERLYTPGLDRREASLPQLRRAVSLDHHVRDRNIELVAQSVDDARLEPIRLAARVGGDDHLVGAMLAELVLDRAKRRVRVSDLAGHGEAVGTCPGERRGETVAGFVELPVDVGGDVVDSGAQDRRDDVELDSGGCTAVKGGAQLRAMKGAVRYHQDARGRRWLPRRSLGSRLTEWAPTVRILGGDRPGESADKGADKQRHADE